MTDITINDRFLLALTNLEMRFERRNGFLSDDDVLDAATAWTLTDFDAEDWTDYETLRDMLFLSLEPADDERGE